jgi:glycosyltransferase involved in cell wall biosynthesis
MAELPLVSIVTCSYNNSKYIIETLESIKNQTYPNIELVIVDDCSTDNSVELIADWLRTYPRKYKFIRHEVNMAGSIPYNVGLRNASGKYYSPIDTDDAMMPEKIAIQVKILEATDDVVAGVYSDAYIMDIHSVPIEGLFIQKYRKFTEIPSGNIYAALLQGNYIPLLSLMIKRSVFDELGMYDESLVYGDYDMWLRINRKYQFLYSDYISAKYRIRPGSLTFTTKNWTYSDVKIFLKHADGPIPIPRLKSLALEAYFAVDKDTMPLVNELADKTNISYFKVAYLLWKFKISRNVGEQVLAKLDEHEQQGASAQLTRGENEINVFVALIESAVSMDVLKEIAYDIYYNNVAEMLPLISRLADKTNHYYFRVVYLLYLFRIPVVYGDVILAKGDTANIAINRGVAINIPAFVEQNWKLFPLESLKNIACYAYSNDIEGKLILIKELAKKTNNQYFRTAYLLCEFGISPVFGEKLLAIKKEYIGTGFSSEMKKGDYPDMAEFVTKICVALPGESLKKIACAAYYNDFVDAKQFIEALTQKTKSRYIKAVSALWRSKVVIAEGKKILAEIEQKGGADKANMLTDLSLYKSISHAKKAS